MNWILASALCMFLLGCSGNAAAQQIECRSSAPLVKAVTSPDNHYVTTRFQFDTPNLQPLLTTSIFVNSRGSSCVIAHFSAHARITDNYIVFQVRIDGVPMQGHLSAIGPYTTPAIVALYDDPSEQLSDPTKVVAYNFFARVGPGTHTVQVMVAAGSGIDPNNLPQVGSPVLTLQHR
ncbi:MAG TPA: hypothetical protein VHJ77_09295 [Vicinamibacterales bacterium]|nr:hypothetical protein [Vicinamibacterales bacterium]